MGALSFSLHPVLQAFVGRRIYIDANIFIYFLEQSAIYSSAARHVLTACAAAQLTGITGQAAVAEVMYGIYKHRNKDFETRAHEFFTQSDVFTVLPHDGACFDRAAKLGATENMKLMDALHVATALQAGCSVLVTNDQGIRSVQGLSVVQLRQLV